MTGASTPDDGFVQSAQTGDVQAFEELFRAVQPPLLRYLRTLVGEDAADVASETWLQVSKDLPKFRGGGNDFKRWVVTIGRHRALDHLRAQRRRPSDPVEPGAMPALPAGNDTLEETEEALATRRALDLIRQLPQDQAEAVLLRVVVGLDAPAAAAVLGKRAGAVRMATSRGLARLKDMLAETPEGLRATPGVTVSGPQTLKD